jgi:putative ABC transport system permease protein
MTVSDEWFHLMRIPLRQGRTFGPEDHEQSQPVVVITETMARRYWPAGDAIGARIQMGPDRESPRLEVVGIVGDARIDLSQPDADPIAFLTTRQRAWHHPYFLLRAQGNPLTLARAAEVELAALDPGLPLHRVRMVDEVISQGLVMRRLPMILMIAFGMLALLLASGGVYAMFASMVAAREREFGVRMALGSQPRSIAALVLRQGGTWMAVGLALGAAGVVLVGGMLRDLLYGVAPLDPFTLLVAVGTLLVCGAVALLAPVRRATRVDPAVALRS